MQIFPVGRLPRKYRTAAGQVQQTTVGVFKSSCMPSPALMTVLPVSMMSIDESRKLVMANETIVIYILYMGTLWTRQ